MICFDPGQNFLLPAVVPRRCKTDNCEYWVSSFLQMGVKCMSSPLREMADRWTTGLAVKPNELETKEHIEM